MHFLTSCDANYLKYLKVLMMSAYVNHPQEKDLTFHILHKNLDKIKIEEVCSFAEDHGQKAHFIQVNEAAYAAVFDRFSSLRWPVECLYIIFAHDMLPKDVDRVLALDIDTVIDGDITEFYYQSFENCALVATGSDWTAWNEQDPSQDFVAFNYVPKEEVNRAKAAKGGYFNSGSFLINLEKLRKDKVDVQFYLDAFGDIPAKDIFFDQGVLNLAYASQTKYMNTCRYNYRLPFSMKGFRSPKSDHYYPARSYQYIPVKGVKIIHYCGTMPIETKPWHFCLEKGDIPAVHRTYLWLVPECKEYFDVWWKYARLTPDFDELWNQQQMNKTVLKYLSKITLDTNLDFANQTGLETLRVPAWREVNSIKRHEDLNDFICPKVYRCVSGEIKETLRNLPKDFTQKRGFRLTVKHISYNAPNAAETPILQILEPNDSSAAVYRRWCGSSLKGEWGKWYKSATHEDISAVQTHVSKMATDVQSFKERLRQLEKQVENADTIKHLTLRELELKTELKTARAELKKEKEKVALFQNSLSFRIGRVVTYVPRKLRALWHR